MKADIDYVGDLVWPTGAPDGVSCERPAKDRLASNLQVRLSLVYFQLLGPRSEHLLDYLNLGAVGRY